MSTRKRLKTKLKQEEESPNPNTDMMKVFDQIQYAYKIKANSL